MSVHIVTQECWELPKWESSGQRVATAHTLHTTVLMYNNNLQSCAGDGFILNTGSDTLTFY